MIIISEDDIATLKLWIIHQAVWADVQQNPISLPIAAKQRTSTRYVRQAGRQGHDNHLTTWSFTAFKISLDFGWGEWV